MKIIILINSLYTGGAEFSTLSFISWLRNNEKINVKLICLKKAYPAYDYKKFGISEVTYLNGKSFIAKLRHFTQILDKFKPDIVHSVLFDANLLGRVSYILKGKFYHIESLVSETYSPFRLKDPSVNNYGLWMYKQIDKYTQHIGTKKFIAITDEVRRHYIKELKIRPEKIDVIYRGRKNNPYLNKRIGIRNELRKEFNINDHDLIFIHVGRQDFIKGHLVLLKALKYVEQKSSSYNITFLFCGRDGNACESIQHFLKENSLKTNIKWLGHRSDIPRLLAGADVFVFPSLYEGLGGALIEAQAAALPIICSNLKVFEEVVEKDVNALSVEINNKKALADAIIKLTEDERRRQKMRRASLNNFLKKFQIDDINQQMLNYYYKVLK